MTDNDRINVLLDKLNGVKRSGKGWLARCPAHEDTHQSLSIGVSDEGKTLIHCHAGCTPEHVLGSVQLGWQDILTSRQPSTVPGRRKPRPRVDDPLKWLADYTGVPEEFIRSLPVEARDGHVAFTFGKSNAVKRRKAGSKDYEWEATGATPPPLWPMPEDELPEEIYAAEGETDCIVLCNAGFAAFAVTKGADKPPSHDHFGVLKSRGVQRVVAIYDSDDPGRHGAEKLCEAASGAGLDVACVDLVAALLVDPLLGQKDVRDAWLNVRDAGIFRNALQAAVVTSREGKSEPTRLIIDAADLVAAEAPAELPSLPLLERDGYIIEGWSHIISGYPKAGKTELLFACVKRWVSSGIGVLWLSEESEAVWRQRVGTHPDFPRGLGLCCALGIPNNELLSIAHASDAQVVIIDTVRNLLGIADENDNSQVAQALGKWEQALAGRTRIYVHHQRKMTGDNGQAIAGAGAFLGCVDRSLELKQATSENRRTIAVRSRIVQPPDLMYEMTDEGLRAIGEAGSLSLKVLEQRALGSLDGEWVTTGDIERGIGDPKPSRPQLLEALNAARRRGLVERDPTEDRQGATYRWRRMQSATQTLPLT